MPSYTVSFHALQRLRQRLPAVAQILPEGSPEADRAAMQQIARWLQQATATGEQLGFDLLLACHLRTVHGEQTFYAAVRPRFTRDRWVVCTVLTPEMAKESVRMAQTQAQAHGNKCRRDRRSSDRLRKVRGVGRHRRELC